MNFKRVLLIASVVVLVAVIIAGFVFAWFVSYRRSVIVVVGNVDMDVEGYYSIINNNEWYAEPEEKYLPIEDEDSKYQSDLKQISVSSAIAYKFVVTNKTENAATLSLRFSDFSEYVFTCLERYVDSGGNLKSAYNGTTLEKKIDEIVKINTAKLTLMFDEFSYSYVDNDTKEEITKHIDSKNYINGDDMYLWRYASGQRYIGNTPTDSTAKSWTGTGEAYTDDETEANPGIARQLSGDGTPYIAKIPLPAMKSGVKTPVSVYFVLKNKQSTASLSDYSDWLLDYGMRRGANMLNYSYKTDGAGNIITDGAGKTIFYTEDGDDLVDADKEKIRHIDGYLTEFLAAEKKAIATTEDDQGELFSAELNLKIDYFEFIGENVPTG